MVGAAWAMLLSAQTGALGALLGPNPLAGTPYSTEHDNYLCARNMGNVTVGDNYLLPCRPPRDDWESQFRDKFVITAWWPPTMNQMSDYAAAHFNLVLGGNLAVGCQYNGTIPNPATTTEAFECYADVIPKMKALGLKFAFSFGSFNRSNGTAAKIPGGAASFGGVTESMPGGYPTAKEVEWVVGELRRRNLTDTVAQYFLHDDDAAASGAVEDSVRWLNTNAPMITPQTNTFPDSGPESLYRTRQFIYSPEEYAVTGTTGNATLKTEGQLQYYENDQLIGERFRLDIWPLFALGDGGGVPVIRSDSLVRVQVYAALAYGARGLYYYCWGHGIWNMPSNPEDNQGIGRGTPTANYPVVKATNADAAVWGDLLIKSKQAAVGQLSSHSVGAIRTGGPPSSVSHSTPPGPGLAVEHMDSGLVVGVFSDGQDLDTGYLMVVDLRTAMSAGKIHPRLVTLTMSAACKATVVPGGSGGYAEQHLHPMEAGTGSRTVSLTLAGGGGALLKVESAGSVDTNASSSCGDVLRSTRDWWFDARTINLKHAYPEISVRSTTYDAWGASARHSHPGGMHPLAGTDSSFIIGGSNWESGTGWRTAAEAKAWSEAGFLAVSLPAGNDTALKSGLRWASAFGSFVLASAQQSSSHNLTNTAAPTAIDTTRLRELSEDYSCSTAWGGFVLGKLPDSSPNDYHGALRTEDVSGIAEASAAMRSSGAYWQLPLTLAQSVNDARQLATDARAPFTAVGLPQPSSANGWAQAVLQQLSDLATLGRKSDVALTPAVQLDACRLSGGRMSESMARFAAYSSVLIGGAQAIWWEGMGKCATVGSAQFALIGSINNRISQWADPLFLRATANAQQPWAIEAVWTTSSLSIPPGTFGSIAPQNPAGVGDMHLIQSMDEEVIAIHLKNTTSVPAGLAENYLLFLSTAVSHSSTTPRTLNIVLSDNVLYTTPIEPDAFQGQPQSCNMRWTGSTMPLTLAGGGVQLATYTLATQGVKTGVDSKNRASQRRVDMIGRRPPRGFDLP